MSDPEKPRVKSKRASKSTSLKVCFWCMSKVSSCALLVFLWGRGMYCLRTNRRRAASSIPQGRFVAASTKTRCTSSPVSLPAAALVRFDHCTRNSFLIRRDASFSPSRSRVPNKESISSTKIIDGAILRASWKSALTNFSDSPRYLDVKEEAEMEKNVDCDSVATALASMVFPVPGGPNKSMPRAGSRNPLKRSGRRNGYTTASFNDFFASSNPAMSSQCTSSPFTTISSKICRAAASSTPRSDATIFFLLITVPFLATIRSLSVVFSSSVGSSNSFKFSVSFVGLSCPLRTSSLRFLVSFCAPFESFGPLRIFGEFVPSWGVPSRIFWPSFWPSFRPLF